MLRSTFAVALWMLVGCGRAAPPAEAPGATTATAEAAPSMTEVAKLMRACSTGGETSEAAIACLTLGALAEMGLGGETAPERADEMYMRGHAMLLAACDADDIDACALVGALRASKLVELAPGSAKTEELARTAIAMLERACRGHHALSCAVVGQLYEEGRGVAADRETAGRYFDRACEEGGEVDACVEAATMVWKDGDPTEDVARLERARASYGRACDRGSTFACEMFAYFCVSEVGGLPQDFEAAAPAYAKACRANSRDACFRLGWIHTRRDRPHEARTAFQRACKLGEERACTATQPLRPLPAQPPGPF